ncbi:MAG TPA: type IV pilus twitching motility protein PilT [Gaiellaceae bacterium]
MELSEQTASVPLSVDAILERGIDMRASDVHLTAGSPPAVRVHGHIELLHDFGNLEPDDVRQLIYRITKTDQQKQLEIDRQLDFAYGLRGKARFRVNTYYQRESLAAAFRLIPADIKTLEDLGLPSALHEFSSKPRGLVLFTGPTGSGKSTSLAALIDEINRSRTDHIITIEDPIEFLHKHQRCIVNQREIGQDAVGFAEALRGALRQDPDVILLGEMRDLETISTALTAAETGHLVFATLHTQDAASTVDRVIDVFPAAQQGQIRTQLAGTLEGVVAQTLLPTADGQGRAAAIEVLRPDDAVRNLVRQAKIEQVYSIMQTGGKKGMQTMEQALAELVLRGILNEDVALARSSRPDQLLGLLGRVGGTTSDGQSAAPLRIAGS